jgi:hypothetical protein
MSRAELFCVAIVVSVATAGVARGEGPIPAAGFKEIVAQLGEIYRTPDSPGGPAAGEPGMAFEAGDDGTLQIRRLVENDRSEFHFRSVTEEKWRMSPADLDAKGVVVQLDPIGVFVPVKKSVKRIVVERCEEKTRIESPDDPGRQWQEKQRFTTSFVFIPASDPRQADEAAALIKRMIKIAPKTKTN